MKQSSSISSAITALYRGQSLANVEAWKEGGVAVSVISGVLSAISSIAALTGHLPPVPPEIIVGISGGIVSIVGGFLAWVQIATTEKIGFKSREDSNAL